MVFHHTRHLDDVRAVHEAVGIEHEHGLVSAAPGADEVADVARLAVFIGFTTPVVDPAESAETAAKIGPGDFFKHPEVEIARVAEDEEVERVEVAGGFDGTVDGLDAGTDLDAVLVVNGHHHGVAFRQRAGFSIRESCDPDGAPAAGKQHVERAEQGVERAQDQQPVEHDEDRQERIVGLLEAHAPEKIGKPQAGDQVCESHAAEEQRASGMRAPAAEKPLAGIPGGWFGRLHQSRKMNHTVRAAMASRMPANMRRMMGLRSMVSHHWAAPLPRALNSSGLGTMVRVAKRGPAAR
jgi:hypothetical protein